MLLENVKGILWHDKINKKDKYGNTWNIIWSEIEKLKQKIISRQNNKETIIRRRVEELLGVEEDLEWD